MLRLHIKYSTVPGRQERHIIFAFRLKSTLPTQPPVIATGPTARPGLSRLGSCCTAISKRCNYNRNDVRPRPQAQTHFPLMSVDPSFTVYRDKLSAPSHGLALWNPDPPKMIYNHVWIGDVGYLREGTFIRMFNVTLPWDDDCNRALGVPEPYDLLDCGPFTPMRLKLISTKKTTTLVLSPLRQICSL